MNNEAKLTFLLDAKNNADKAFNDVRSSMDKVKGKLESMKPAFTAMAAVGTVAFGALVVGAKKCIDASQEAAMVQAQLEAVLKSTGQVAGITAEKAIELSQALQKQTTYGDEAILSAENILLTFTNIKDDIFPDATKIVLDMSTALGQDLQSSAIQVGKALQDPILGVTALRRVGVNFNEAQTEVIKNLVETGRAAEAQRLIIQELTTEFGGSAEAQTQTFAGRIEMLKNNIGDLQEEIGNALIPILDDVLKKMVPVVEKVMEWVEKNPELTKNIILAGIAISGLVAAIGVLGLVLPGIIIGMGYIKTAIGLVFSWPGGAIALGIAAAIAAIIYLWQNWDEISKKVGEICDRIGGFFREMGEKIHSTVMWIIDQIGNFIGTLQNTLEGIAEFLLHPIEGAKKVISALGAARKSIEDFNVAAAGNKIVIGEESQGELSYRAAPAEAKNETTVNFTFNGDISDKEDLMKFIKDTINRDSELINNAGI